MDEKLKKFKENFSKLLYELRVQENERLQGRCSERPMSYRKFWEVLSEKGIDFNYNSVNTWEKMASTPKIENLLQIAHYMEISFVDLYKKLMGIEGETEEFTIDGICESILDWEEEEKIELVEKLFKEIIPSLPPEKKLDMIKLVTSSQP